MVKQYPYTLEQYLTADATLGTTGDWESQPAAWEEVSTCRDEGNGGWRMVRLTDGTAIVYSSLIQLPKTCPVIKAGTRVRVVYDATVRVEGTVLRYQADQLHTRVWV